MTRAEYMTTLAHNLRRLPREDFDRAMEYFEEYFNEAGPEHEAEAVHDLGSPEDASRELIMDLAEKNIQEPPKTVKRGLHAVWVGILGVCAAPIALPLLLAFVCVIFALLITVFAFIFAFFVSAAGITAGGVLTVAGGVALLFSTFSDGLSTIGAGLFTLGAGILFLYGSFLFCRWTLRKMSRSLGTIPKGGRKHENKY